MLNAVTRSTKGQTEKFPRPCSTNLLPPDLQRAVYLLVKLNALRKPATKSLDMALHRPGGHFRQAVTTETHEKL
jgi:hypothetical protein